MARYQDSQLYAGLRERNLYVLTEFFKMLGNPARIRILLLLMEQDANQRSGRAAWNDPICGVTPVKFAEIK